MKKDLFTTTVVGSMPRPQYVRDLIEEQVDGGLSSDDFRRMMDSAIPYVAQMQELAGIDVISDGEWRRKSYIGVIADICSGFELSIKEVQGQRQTWHVVTSELDVVHPGLLAKEAGFLKRHTERDVKVAIPSPYLIGERMWDPELVRKTRTPPGETSPMRYVPILEQELIALRDEGVAMAQIDDPHLCLFVDPNVRAQYDDPAGRDGLLRRPD